MREPATGGSVARERGDELKKNVLGQGVGREVCAVFTFEVWSSLSWICANQTCNFQQGEEGLGGLPNDAVTQGKKDRIGLADTTNENSAARKAAGEK